MSMCFIHGLSGIAGGSGTEPPAEYKPYVEKAKTLFTGEYDGYYIAENFEYLTVAFILNNFSITGYIPATTEFMAYGWYSCRYKKDTEIWETFDFAQTASTGWNYTSNIKYVSQISPSDAPIDQKIYGVVLDKTSSSETLTRTQDAVGLSNPVPCTADTTGSSPFDSIYPWNQIKLCNILNDGTLIYQGDERFSRTPTSGDVLVEIPKFYVKIIPTENTIEWQISAQPFSGSFVSPAHCDRGDGKGERNKVYVGAYTSNNTFRSISGNASLVAKTRAEFRNGHAERGVGYYNIDFATWCTITMLYLVEYAHTNSQDSIGSGYVYYENSEPLNTGGADYIGGADAAIYHTGTASAITRTDQAAVKYRHMENLWGNIYWFVDGITFDARTVYICLNPTNFEDTTTNYINLGIERSYMTGYDIENLAVPKNFPWAMYPSYPDDKYAMKINDYCRYNEVGTVLRVGGHWDYSSSAGLFCMDGRRGSAEIGTAVGARLMYLP